MRDDDAVDPGPVGAADHLPPDQTRADTRITLDLEDAAAARGNEQLPVSLRTGIEAVVRRNRRND
jgi:hypothetical protein